MIQIVKFIFYFILILLVLGCNERLQPQTSAEKAIEQKQNEIWIQRVSEISKFALRWRFFAQTTSDKWSQEMVWDFESLNSEFKIWSENIAVESKISIAPKQFTILQEEVKSNYKIAFANYHEAFDKIKAENKRKQIENEKLLKESREEQQRNEEFKRQQLIKEEQDKKIELARLEQQKALINSNRLNLLSQSIDYSKKEQETYEKNYSTFKFSDNRTISVLSDASGRAITWGATSEYFAEAKIRILNSSKSRYDYFSKKEIMAETIYEVFLEFSIQEANESNSSCFGNSYKFKQYLRVYILPSDVKEIAVQVPRFFKNACWGVTVRG